MKFRPEKVLFLYAEERIINDYEQSGFDDTELAGCAALWGNGEIAFIVENISDENRNKFIVQLDEAINKADSLILTAKSTVGLISDYANNSANRLRSGFDVIKIGAGGFRGNTSPSYKKKKEEEKLEIKSAVRTFAIIANKANQQEIAQNADPLNIELSDLLEYYGITPENTGRKLIDRVSDLKAAWEIMQPFYYDIE